jgi:hypothetical protein
MGRVQEGLMLAFTIPQIIFFAGVGIVMLMVTMIVTRMLRA